MTESDTEEKRSAVDNVMFAPELAKLKGVSTNAIYYQCRNNWAKHGLARQDPASNRQCWIIDYETAMRYSPSQKD